MIGALLAALLAATPVPRSPPPDLRLVPAGYRAERVVLLYRHGVRAPLDGEAAAAALARGAWPVWATPASQLTPHGREGARLFGRYDRAWLAAAGLARASGCPAPGEVAVRSNSEERTIASAQEWSEGFAPGCELPVEHRAPGVADPLFDGGAAALEFDMAAGLADVARSTGGGPGALVAREGPALAAMAALLGCDRNRPPCRPGEAASGLRLTADGRGLELSGPIRDLSGTAEVFLLEKAEGMADSQVAWGRGTPERLQLASRLHTRLFDIFDRSPLMARRTSAALGPAIAAALTGKAPVITVFVGHDNNIAAIAARIGTVFQLPGYAEGDPPIGGALGFLLLRRDRDSARFVRIFYQAQTLEQLAKLRVLSMQEPPALALLAPASARGLIAETALQALLTEPARQSGL